MKKVTLQVPATIANIVCGFDVLGMAIEEPYDTLTVSLQDSPGIEIVHTDAFGLPVEPSRNVAGVSLQAMLDELPNPPGLLVEIHKNIMPGSGLGSSAASSMGAVAAANRLLGDPFDRQQLLQFAMQGEKLAGGMAHADNVAPCLYGGITLLGAGKLPSVTGLPAPPLWVTLVHPQIEVKTSDSRKIIRKDVPLASAVTQWSNVAGLVAGFCLNDFGLIARSMQDVIFEPVRSMLIPGFDDIKARSLAAGALGGGISGSGPSIFMLSETHETARAVEDEMAGVCNSMAVPFKTYITKIRQSALV